MFTSRFLSEISISFIISTMMTRWCRISGVKLTFHVFFWDRIPPKLMCLTYSRFWWHMEKRGNWKRSLLLISSCCKLIEMRKVLIPSVRKCLVLPSTRVFSRLRTEPQKTANELNVKMPPSLDTRHHAETTFSLVSAPYSFEVCTRSSWATISTFPPTSSCS